jgi:hypothetical protein
MTAKTRDIHSGVTIVSETQVLPLICWDDVQQQKEAAI